MNPENKKISIIVIIAQDYGIGKDNKLLWHIGEDLKRFKRITEGHTVVMGKNTYFSLPYRPLKNRRNIVITDIPGEQIEGCVMAYSIEDAVKQCDMDQENFIIGGASIYRQFFDLAQKLYITHVQKTMEADTFFPEIKNGTWEVLNREPQTEVHPEGLQYEYVVYQRRNNS